MQTCAGCGYLVPASWDECKKCGAALGAAVPARVAAPAAVPAGPTPSVVPAASAPPAESAAALDWSAPVRFQPAQPAVPSTQWALPSDPSRPVAPGAVPEASPPRRVSGGMLAGLVVVVALAGGGAWIASGGLGGSGTRPAQLSFALPYVAPSGAFETMLPCRPQTDQQAVPIGAGVSTTVSYAACIGSDPVVMVGDAAVPAGTPGFDPSTALRSAADGATFNSGGTIAEYRETLHDGLPAADVRIAQDGATVRMRVVLGGSAFGATSLVIAIVADDDGDPEGDFDRLVESLAVMP